MAGTSMGFIVEGQEPPEGGNVSQSEQAEMQSVTPGTFQALGIPAFAGTRFSATDTSNSPLASQSSMNRLRVVTGPRAMRLANAYRQRAIASG